jgi:hypothetical protein
VCVSSATAIEAIHSDTVSSVVKNKSGENISEEEYNTASASVQQYDSVLPSVPVANTMSKPLYEPLPVLVQPQVMYVVINAWESETGVLNFQSTHLIDITERSWSFGLRDAVKVQNTAPFTVAK